MAARKTNWSAVLSAAAWMWASPFGIQTTIPGRKRCVSLGVLTVPSPPVTMMYWSELWVCSTETVPGS